MLFIPSSNVLSRCFCFISFGGSTRCLNFGKFRDAASSKGKKGREGGGGSEMKRPGRCCVELHYGTVFN